MSGAPAVPAPVATTPGTSPAPATVRTLLACGVAGPPLYLVVAVAQGLTREGFEFTRHPASLLSNGDLGWIQIANFVITGALIVAGAVGMRRALRSAWWRPVLVAGYGAGMVLSGVFPADPIEGFPSGTSAGAAVSTAGVLHFVVGGLGFGCLVTAAVIFARRFAAAGERAWAGASVAAGVLLLAGFAGIASSGGSVAGTVGMWLAVTLAMAWLAAVFARLRAHA